MGNETSTIVEDEKAVLEDLYQMSLDDPGVDQKVNEGTTFADCQPRHTKAEVEAEAEAEKRLAERAGVQDSQHNSSSGSPRSSGGSATGSERGEHRGRKSQQQHQEPEKMGYVAMAKAGYQELVNAIIRPPRAQYKEENLGPPAFSFCGRRFTRTDFTLRTKRGLNLQCSHWEPVERTSARIPAVIYMHGNSSARVEVLPQLSYLLSLGVAVFAFDFAGSGKSDGEYVSLGFYEREDLMCVIAHLRATDVVSTIALWGRSMGAATALMHGDRDPSIACMVLDSSFSDLTKLCEEMVDKAREQGINVPNFVTNVAIRMIRGSVKKQADFDIRTISPISHAPRCFIPALFVAGEHDDFIDKSHSQNIHDAYAGDKNMIVVEGDHNSPRPRFMFDSVSIFLQTCLQIPNSWALQLHPRMNLMAPPWYYPGTPAEAGEEAGVTSPRRNVANAAARADSNGGPRDQGVESPPTPSSSSTGGEVEGQQQQEPPVDHLDAAEEAAAALAAETSEEMGMTAERQREIQASLFKMLGQQDDDNGEGGEGEGGQQN